MSNACQLAYVAFCVYQIWAASRPPLQMAISSLLQTSLRSNTESFQVFPDSPTHLSSYFSSLRETVPDLLVHTMVSICYRLSIFSSAAHSCPLIYRKISLQGRQKSLKSIRWLALLLFVLLTPSLL